MKKGNMKITHIKRKEYIHLKYLRGEGEPRPISKDE